MCTVPCLETRGMKENTVCLRQWKALPEEALQAWFWPNPEWKLALARMPQETLPRDDAEPKDHAEPGPLV